MGTTQSGRTGEGPATHRAGSPLLHPQRPVLPPYQGRTGLGELHSRQLSGMTFKAKGTRSSKEASRITALMSG